MDAVTSDQYLQSERWKLQVQLNSGWSSPPKPPIRLHGGGQTGKTLPVMSPILASAHLARGPKLLLQQFKDYTQTGGMTIGKHSLSYTHSEMDRPPGNGGFRQPLFVGDHTITRHNGNTISILHPEDSVDVFEGLKSSEQAGAGLITTAAGTGGHPTSHSFKMLPGRNPLSFQNIQTKPIKNLGYQTELIRGAESELGNIPSNIVNESNGGWFSAISGDQRGNSAIHLARNRSQSGNFLVLPLNSSPAPRMLSFHKHRETSTMAEGQSNSDLNQVNKIEVASAIPSCQKYKFIPSPGIHNQTKMTKQKLKLDNRRGQPNQREPLQHRIIGSSDKNPLIVNEGDEIIIQQEDQDSHLCNRKFFKGRNSAITNNEPLGSEFLNQEEDMEGSNSNCGTVREARQAMGNRMNRELSVASKCIVKQQSQVAKCNITSLVFVGTPFEKNTKSNRNEVSKHQISYHIRNGNSHLGLLDPHGGGRSVISSQQKRLDHSSQTSSSFMDMGADDQGISAFGSSRTKQHDAEGENSPVLSEKALKLRSKSREP
jgi:hypothetical protein